MQRLDIPVNVGLLEMTPQRLAATKQIRALDIFEGGTVNFHEEGLFSTSAFGRVGSDERDLKFGFIDIRTTIFHPFFYYQLVNLKGLYRGIMSGKSFAIWDEAEKDFISSDPATGGQTGYQFFMEHWEKIQFKKTGSDVRDLRIQFIQKNKGKCLVSKVPVIPAGLRDVQIEENGGVKEGEINEMYRALIQISNGINTTTVGNTRVLDTSRHSLQMTMNKIFDFIIGLIEGKNGFFMDRFSARRITNGTRNVLTSMDTSQSFLGGVASPDINSTGLGLFQTLKAALPIAKHHILKGWISRAFNSAEGNANLVNASSLRREIVKVTSTTIDRWTTSAGIEKVINAYREVSIRNKPILIEGYYLGLLYEGPDDTFKIFGDITELPPENRFDKKNVRPITFSDLLYISTYRILPKLVVYNTRYPVTGDGSIYPSKPFVKTTLRATSKMELGEDWQPLGREYIAPEFPDHTTDLYFDSCSVHPSRYAGLGADNDGDTGSNNVVYTDEAIQEAEDFLNSTRAYLDSAGGLRASPCVETVNRVLFSITGG